MRARTIGGCLTVVLLIVLVAAAAPNAGGKSAKSEKKSEKSAKSLKCETSGTFLNGANADTLGPSALVTSSIGRCNLGFGQVGTVGVAQVIEPPDAGWPDNCIALASAPNGAGLSPSIIYNKKGDSVLFEIDPGTPAMQCFFAADGTTAVPPAAFCGDSATTAYYSTSTAPFTIVSGTGKYAGATGGGTLMAYASHCDAGKPLANWVESEVTDGTLMVP